MSIRVAWIVAAGVLLAGAVPALVRPLTAQPANPAAVSTRSGFAVEEVKVGTSCVVIVSRAGSGPSDHLAVVPCTR